MKHASLISIVLFGLTYGAETPQDDSRSPAQMPTGETVGKPNEAPKALLNPIEAVVLHRLFSAFYMCGEHFEGEEQESGDALGADCVVQNVAGEIGQKSGMVRAFRGDGARNEDWYGWNMEVLAPFDGVIEAVRINPATNRPGEFGTAPASSIRFRRADGMHVLFAHVQDIRVAAGDAVVAGQVVARVGNNGYGRCPHVHVGAWKVDRPYQVRWDLRSGMTK